MDKIEIQRQILAEILDTLLEDELAVKIFNTRPTLIYKHKDPKAKDEYYDRTYLSEIVVPKQDWAQLWDWFYYKASRPESGLTVARDKDYTYKRFRLTNENSSAYERNLVKLDFLSKFNSDYSTPVKGLVKPEEPLPGIPLSTLKENYERKKKMKDFSLTNIKDAIVNKVTNLDKKTITILALIALVLLVACRYNDIKDIFKSIRDKISRSKNFKAMKEDAASALNGLKKIVGIKNTEGDVSNES